MESHEAEGTKRRAIFGRRKIVPRAMVVDGKKHNRAFLVETLGELGFIAGPCPADPDGIIDMAPDLVVLGIAGSNGSSEIGTVLRKLAEYEFAGTVLVIGPPHAILVRAIRQLCNELGLAMLPVLPTPFGVEALRGHVAKFLSPTDAPSPDVDVAEALKLGWLELWYQHKIDVRSLLPTGAEALVRIRHPAWGIISPASFIPDPKDLSFRGFSEFVVARALEDWHRFVQDRPIEISINLPLAFLKDRPALLDLCRKLPGHPAFGGLLIEINSDEIVSDGALVVDIAQELRFRNLAISVDDVGTEWPELAKLAIFPFTELKVDRQFVVGCADDRLKRVVCRGIIDLAKDFGARTVAKGVETRTDFRAVQDMGFDQVQGFLFGKPVSAQKFARSLAAPPP